MKTLDTKLKALTRPTPAKVITQQALKSVNKNPIIVLFVLLLLTALSASAQIVNVGSGGYTTQLPPPDAAGRNVNPTGTPRVSGNAVTKPRVSNDWWTGLLTFDGANLYNYPMSLRALNNGLVVSYTFQGMGADDTRQPMSGDQPILAGVSGLTVTNPTVSDYSDWTVTAAWSGGGHTFNATIGMGMPFVYCTKGASDVASVTISMGTVSVQSEMILVTNSLSGSNYAVYAPVGSTWTQSGTTYTSTLAGKNYYSVAMLPPGVAAATAAADFKQYAYVFPANTAVTWSYDNATQIARSTFTVTTDKKEGTGTNVLLGLLPHQWAHLGAGSATPGSYTYSTVRGTMKMLASNTFIVENKFKGVLPTLPNTAKNSAGFDPGALAAKIDQVKGDGLQLWTDSYNDGLAMNRLIQVAKIADQQGNTAARDQIISTVKTRLESWFKADAGENAFIFYYNNTWSTLIGYPAGYYSDANLNDHHFHYGYFISAAAAVEEFQPGWSAQWGGMVNMLVKDAANWDKTDTMFPFLRNFHPYAGHSFATGLLNNEPHGNNQEASSEAMNFNASLIHWGAATGNNTIRDLGIYLYTTEQTAVEEYYFNMNNRNFPATYNHPMASRVWGNGIDRGTFWTNDIAAMYGIEMVPMTGSSFYLGQNTTYVTKLWNDMKAQTGVLSNVANDNLWYDVYWSYLAFVDPAQAITLYNNYPNHAIKNGESDANTYNWLHSFNGVGQLDATVTANYPIAAVFNKGGVKTYVAHNYGASAITVTYSDGFSMSVPARTMKSNNDIDAKATVVASSTQIPTNGTITLTATVTGTVTKVDFYNGTSLLGSKTAAPYTFTTAALPAGKPNFYVRVYNGTQFNLSNVVRVFVGSQLPYGGTAWAVPGTIEAGSYDYFEGGVGQEVSYFDTDAANQAGSFRSPEYVDAGATTGEGNTVGWISDGEWMEYTVNVASAGTYNMNIRYTSGNSTGGGPFWFENSSGTKISPDITVAMNDVNWTAYADKAVTGVTLAAGVQVIRMKVGTAGFNLGKMTFTYTGGNVAVTGVTVSPTSASIAAGATQQLAATIAPSNATNKNVTWSSSNTAIATVSATGLVTGVAAGTATITVTTQDGAKTATSAITVTAPNVAVTGVTVSPTSASIAAGATQQLTSTIAPSNATNKNVTWSSSNTAVATVNTSGLVTGVAGGSAVITVTTQDGAKTATSTITVTSSSSLPAPWVTADIGSVGVTGTAAYASPTFSAQGSGADIWDVADGFRYIYQTVTGDVTITARVATLGASDPWAKAGVMVRETTAAGSTHALTAVTSANGLAFQNRLTTGATSNHTAGPAGAAPYWVRVTRAGNSFTSFISANGTTWTQVGAATTIAMGSQVLVGLAVTSHNNAVLNAATFDNVTVTAGSVAVTGVAVSPTTASINVGTTQQLTATVAPSNATNKNVTWSSGNTAIATVSSTGLVTAISAGTVVITVTTQDGAKTATSTITVLSGTILVTGVTVSPTSASITAGGTQQLTATVAPSNATNKNVTWSSSNTAIATVNTSGLVTAVAVGSATITVTTQDGAKTATSAITVTAATVAVTGVTVSPTSASIAVGATQQLTATVAPSNATNKTVTWSSSNTAVATVNTSGLVTAVAAGTATITVTTQSGGKTATSAITVTASSTCVHTSQFGDYTVEISSASPNPTLKFIPARTGVGSPVCLLYYGTTPTGNYPGNNVTPNTPFQITAAAGVKVYFYYTYSLPTGGEQNTSGARDSYTVGGACNGRISDEGVISETDFELYPNPVATVLTIKGATGHSVGIINMQGMEISNEIMTSDDKDVSQLAPGVYTVMVSKDNTKKFKRFVKK
jgi:endo-1,3(4)-beta-glucanase